MFNQSQLRWLAVWLLRVALAIRLVISGEIDTSGGDPTDGGCLPDSTPGRATAVFELAHATDVDGKDLPYGSCHRLASFQVRPTLPRTSQCS